MSLLFRRLRIPAVASRPASLLTQTQNVTFYIDSEFGPGLDKKLKHFGIYGSQMGSDPYPYHRKEHLKRKEWRYMQQQKRVGKLANYKVRSLVDFIEFKKAHNYR